jgi:peptidyl-prolyl isomerase H (cyclophilin H)
MGLAKTATKPSYSLSSLSTPDTTTLPSFNFSSQQISSADVNRPVIATMTDTTTAPLVSPDPNITAALERGNIVCFFDVTVGSTPVGRIKMELYKTTTPKTAENFRQLCCGEYKPSRFPLGYKGTIFHRVIKKFMIQGGDFINNDGTGSESIYGSKFADENFTVKHDTPGLLSMANNGKNTNGCQFFITCAATPHLDGKHVCFGRVLDESSMQVVRMIEASRVNSSNNKPSMDCIISECGEL